MFTESVQSTSLKLFDRSGTFPHNFGHLLHREIRDDPQGQDLFLVFSQDVKQFQHFPRCHQLHGRGFSRGGFPPVKLGFERLLRRRPALPSVIVDHSRMGHREKEGPQSAGTPADGFYPGKDRQEDILHGGLRVLHATGGQVSQHLRRVAPIDQIEQLAIVTLEGLQ